MNTINIIGKVFWVSTTNKAPFPQTTLGISTGDKDSVFINFPRDHQVFNQKYPDIKGKTVFVPEVQFQSSEKDGRFFFSAKGSNIYISDFRTDLLNQAMLIGKVDSVSNVGFRLSIQKRRNPKKPDDPPGFNIIPVWLPDHLFKPGQQVLVTGKLLGKREEFDQAHIEAKTVEEIQFTYKN